MICSGDGVRVRPSAPPIVRHDVHLVRSRRSPVQRERELSPNGLISCGQSVESSDCNPVRKRQKSFMRQRGRWRPTACCTSLSLSGPSFPQCLVRQSVSAPMQSPLPTLWPRVVHCRRESYHIGRRRKKLRPISVQFGRMRGRGGPAKNHHLTFWVRIILVQMLEKQPLHNFSSACYPSGPMDRELIENFNTFDLCSTCQVVLVDKLERMKC